METTGTPPCHRAGHCAVIVGHDQMLVIGGHDSTNFFNDIFKLNIETGVWSQITTKATVPRMAYHDAVRVGRNILIYGGQRKSGGLIKEMWKVRFMQAASVEISLALTHPSLRSSSWIVLRVKRFFGPRFDARVRLLNAVATQ